MRCEQFYLRFVALKKTLYSHFFLRRGHLSFRRVFSSFQSANHLLDLRVVRRSVWSSVYLASQRLLIYWMTSFSLEMFLTPRPRFFSSPDRGFGNLVRPSVSSAAEEECFFMPILIFCSGIHSCDLLQLDWFYLLDVLVVVFFGIGLAVFRAISLTI